MCIVSYCMLHDVHCIVLYVTWCALYRTVCHMMCIVSYCMLHAVIVSYCMLLSTFVLQSSLCHSMNCVIPAMPTACFAIRTELVAVCKGNGLTVPWGSNRIVVWRLQLKQACYAVQHTWLTGASVGEWSNCIAGIFWQRKDSFLWYKNLRADLKNWKEYFEVTVKNLKFLIRNEVVYNKKEGFCGTFQYTSAHGYYLWQKTRQPNCHMNCDSAGNDKNQRILNCMLCLSFYGGLTEKREGFPT